MNATTIRTNAIAAAAKANAKRDAAKPVSDDAQVKATKAGKAAALRVKILAAVITRETALVQHEGAARVAYAASVTGRFSEHGDAGKLTADDLLGAYPGKAQAKTRTNRASELNAAARTGELLGTGQSQRLLDACMTFGGRLREEWRVWSANARRTARETLANGGDKAKAGAQAVTLCIELMLEAQAGASLREQAAAAKRDADKAGREADHAAAYVAKVSAKAEESGDAASVKPAEKAAAKAAQKAQALRVTADAITAKLPTPVAPMPRTADKVTQDVKVAMGSEALPLAALAAMARDLCVRFRAGGDVATADAIGKAVEKYAV